MRFPNASMRFCPQDISPFFPKTHFDRPEAQKPEDPKNLEQRRVFRAIELRTERQPSYNQGQYCTFAESVRNEMMQVLKEHEGDSVDLSFVPRGALRILRVLQREPFAFSPDVQKLTVQTYLDFVRYRGRMEGLEGWMKEQEQSPRILDSRLGAAIAYLLQHYQEPDKNPSVPEELGSKNAA